MGITINVEIDYLNITGTITSYRISVTMETIQAHPDMTSHLMVISGNSRRITAKKTTKLLLFSILWRNLSKLECCNPWPHVANRHISISQL